MQKVLDRSPVAVMQPLSKDATLIHAIQPFSEASAVSEQDMLPGHI